jgi:hypothetical protein
MEEDSTVGLWEERAEELEEIAEMPEAILRFLRRHREGVPGGADWERYRRVDYSYPLRRIPDPVLLRVSAGRGGPTALPRPPRSTAPEPGVTVIAF